jgi:predicted RNA-binding protein associated with RNAse of E/G family
MKKISADRQEWRQNPDAGCAARRMDFPDFSGELSLVHISRIDKPWQCSWSSHRYCIADVGHYWLTHFPDGAPYVMHSVFDGDERLIHWYVDICGRRGVSEEGIPWFEDLFLDIVVLPSGEHAVLDAEELDRAHRGGIVSSAQREKAQKAAREVTRKIEEGSFDLFALSRKHFDLLKKELSSGAEQEPRID